MKKIFETAVIILGTIGWWGFVYPELCLTEDVYEQAYEDGGAERNPENRTQGAEDGRPGTPEDGIPGENREGTPVPGVWGSVRADGYRPGWQVGKIRIKSRLAEYVYQVKEKETAEKEQNYDK